MKTPLFISSIVVATLLGMSVAFVFLSPSPMQLQAATWFGEQARPIPEFSLANQRGEPFNPDSMRGHWHLLFFGYTHCPDICPDTMQMMAKMIDQIEQPDVREQLRVTFVSVDPERDTAQLIGQYAQHFHPEIHSARGDITEVNKLTDSLGVLHYITKTKDESSYEVAHSGVLTLIDPQGRYAALFNTPHDPGKIAHDLTTLVQG